MQTRMEQYIDATTATLKALPEVDREQEVAEIRGHLEAMVAAREAGGEARDEAVQAAIRQFDAGRQVGAELQSVSRGAALRRMRPEAAAILFGLAVYGLGNLFGLALHVMISGPGGTLGPLLSGKEQSPWLIEGGAALGVLLATLGWRGVLREARRSDTAWGVAARWCMWTQALSLAMLVSRWALGPAVGDGSDAARTWAAVSPWVFLAVGATAAYTLSRRSGQHRNAYRGIIAAAAARSLLDTLMIPAIALQNGTLATWVFGVASVPGYLSIYLTKEAIGVGIIAIAAAAGAATARHKTASV